MNLALPFLPNQSALHTIRTVVGTRGRGRRSKLDHHLDALRKDLVEKGDLLLESLRRERNFETCPLPNDSTEIATLWRECRQAVERAAEDYATALDRWQEALSDSLKPGAANRSPEPSRI